MLLRHKNSISNSSIVAVLTFFGEGCGSLGPRLMIQHTDSSSEDLAPQHLADFLNEATGRDNSKRTISEDVEKNIVQDFSDLLKFENGRYSYIGPESKVFLTSYRHIRPESRQELNSGEKVINMNEEACLMGPGIIKTFGLVGCIAIGGSFELENGEKASILTHRSSVDSDQNLRLFSTLYLGLENKFKIKEGRIFIFHNEFSEMSTTQLFSFQGKQITYTELIKQLEVVLSKYNYNILIAPYTNKKGKQIHYDKVNDDYVEMAYVAKIAMQKEEKDMLVPGHASINTLTQTYETNLINKSYGVGGLKSDANTIKNGNSPL